MWLVPIEPVHCEGGILRLRVPNSFFIDTLRDKFQARIQQAFQGASGQPVSIEYAVTKDGRHPAIARERGGPARRGGPAGSSWQEELPFSDLNPRYTFESFLVGPNNRLAHATAEAICKNPGKQYNPFFIYGGVGLGKTHLLHAIGHDLRRKHGRARVLYTTAEAFVNEYIDLIKSGKADTFRGKYRNLDCLLIDDIQFLIAKERSEEEFFHTFNTLFESRKQIVISSDRAPKELAPSEQRLISRFLWGQVVDIRPPDLETRIAILRRKCELDALDVPDDVIQFVAIHIKTNIRELEGALTRLGSNVELGETRITIDDAREILKDMITVEAAAPVRLETIQRLVAERHSVDVNDLKTESRASEFVLPRQLAMYLSYRLTGLSTTAIGEAFGGRDHSTVVHARRKIERMLEQDPFFASQVNKLTEDIRKVEKA